MFKERLKELRMENNITQEKLGKMTGMSKMTISHWESGYCEPSIDQLIILSDIFSVSIDYLVGKKD